MPRSIKRKYYKSRSVDSKSAKKQKRFYLHGGFDTSREHHAGLLDRRAIPRSNSPILHSPTSIQQSGVETPPLLNLQPPHRKRLVESLHIPCKATQHIRLEVLCEKILHFGVVVDRFGED